MTVFVFLVELWLLLCSVATGVKSLINYLLDRHSPERSRCVQGMQEAEDYADWYQHAMEYCNSYGFYHWRKDRSDGLFDYAEIQHRIKGIRSLLKDAKNSDTEENIQRLMVHLRSDIVRGPCGICKTAAFTYNIGTKRVIEEYIEAIQEAIDYISGLRSIAHAEIYSYLNECLKCHGMSALLLSGGQSLSMYHMGVCRGLFNMGVLPRVICATGTSAVVASFICCTTDLSLTDFFADNSAMYEKYRFDAFMQETTTSRQRSRSRSGEGAGAPEPPKEKDEGLFPKMMRRFRRFCETGTFMDIEVVAEFVTQVLGDITFREAFDKTGRTLNIVISNLRECSIVVPHTSYTLHQSLVGGGDTKWVANYLTAPDVLVRTAAVAAISQGIVGTLLWKGYGLLRKNPKTGAIEPFSPSAYHSNKESAESMAVERISEQFNVTCVIRVTTHMSLFPSSYRPPKDVKTSFASRLGTEVLREAQYRGVRVLRAMRRFPVVGRAARKIMSLDFFLRDVDVDVDIMSYEGASTNVLEKPTREIATRRMMEGERALWPCLAKTQQYLAVEETLHQSLVQVSARVDTAETLLADSFPFPEVLSHRREVPVRAASAYAMPFPTRSNDDYDEALQLTPSNSSLSFRDSLAERSPPVRNADAYESGYSGSMIMRHLAKRSSVFDSTNPTAPGPRGVAFHSPH
eukprot:TRINITY_DN30678_c0_g1_i1.p1 TRINITY_DN30678_c0_g1~~TRINITY_DN30678_c0_g1_i1.p1  ORF type:complete len:698 (+),score=260.45 TRINITY_DN30678_c0_g1_i1:35-2095(+)